jgi:phage/plasmid-associated DNA primase
LQRNVTYKIYSSDVKSKLFSEVTELIQNSYNSLTKESQYELYKKTYSDAGEILKSEKPKIFSNTFVEKFYPQLFSLLVNDEIKFDTYFNEIHFNNGFVDLKTLEFKQREQGKHYITKYIERDYKPSTQEQQNHILSHIRKTYPSEEDLKIILLSLGSSLSGKSYIDQDTLFLLGEGSSGKSNILLLTQACITVYFQELQSDTFAHGNSKIDKILMTYQKNPQIRISWCNELKDTKIDDSLFKSFIDSNLNATALYADGQKSFKHYSKTFITANTMPNIKVDTGVSRRFKGYTHTSKFVSDPELVNEKSFHYLLNNLFINCIENS